uniref:H/ACA ribonucleoprotein complex non-core subunit NAF1 n=1 Tax=Wuchereria bancrofti TaxID=6293 RepID=A0AAF5PJC3_WUCBA
MNSDKIDAWIDHKNNIKTMRVNNEAGKDNLLQTVVAEVVTNIVDSVCNGCISFDYFFDRFNILNVDSTSFRIAQSTRNNELSESTFIVQSSSDSSDDEFDRILKSTGQQMSLQLEEEDDDVDIATSTKTNLKLIEHEYDTMLAIEELRIHVEEDILLKQFGRIVNVVDRLVVIEADSNTALDFDSVIFDSERNAVGRVFDIFGPVAKPMYAILFNDVEEASEWRVDSIMYYAPSASQFTHTIFTEKLRQQKATDRCWDGEGECPVDMLAFSDDEVEQRYKAKHRSMKVNGRGQHMFGNPRSKKARYSSKYGRSKCRNNRRYNITSQFRNGSEQYGGTTIDSHVEQNPAQQSSFCSATVEKSGPRPFQHDLCLTSFGMVKRSSHLFFERNIERNKTTAISPFPCKR